MQFFAVTDEFDIKHKVLVVPLSGTEMNELSSQCKEVCRQFQRRLLSKEGTHIS